jgi:hypothetical protein
MVAHWPSTCLISERKMGSIPSHTTKIKIKFSNVFLIYILFICMGRKLKYKTPEEKKQANRDRVMKHYNKNKNRIKKKNLERYYKNKEND